MDITTLLNEIQEDLRVDEFNLKDKQLKLPAIKHKYAGMLIRTRIELNELNNKKEQAKKTLINSIIEKSPVKVSTAVAEKSAEDASSIKTIQSEIKEKELIIALLEKTEKTLSSMTFDIKNIIDIIKLETT
jgi:hypothetical protein